ncbi:lysophospholipase [Flavihumibacter solisilvae]|uniref:Lysophospholipase n=1 Tax=Flavihumibacter solisilvae TaxID=1349421 RepID=A0A0C1LEZ8_9BACT|nr:lysophospholipase [Flavihumibacter solisilvae]
MNSYLALGDSYTIGEQVPIYESFPYQLVQRLRNAGYPFSAPEIIAKTGWTTGELIRGIGQTQLLPEYDLVTLLAGVNNQYRGYTTEAYEIEFRALMATAINCAGNRPERVVVVSIPDWGVTPFAAGKNRKLIALEIDTFNGINRNIAAMANARYVDITAGTREAAENPLLLAADGLHPSGADYARWADRIAAVL